MAKPENPTILDLDEGTELVRLAEAVIPAPGVEVVKHVRGWWVVMREARLERQLGQSLDRLGRNPGHRRNRRLDPHLDPSAPSRERHLWQGTAAWRISGV